MSRARWLALPVLTVVAVAAILWWPQAWWHSWYPLQHWLAVHTGTDNEPGPFYGLTR